MRERPSRTAQSSVIWCVRGYKSRWPMQLTRLTSPRVTGRLLSRTTKTRARCSERIDEVMRGRKPARAGAQRDMEACMEESGGERWRQPLQRRRPEGAASQRGGRGCAELQGTGGQRREWTTSRQGGSATVERATRRAGSGLRDQLDSRVANVDLLRCWKLPCCLQPKDTNWLFDA